MTEQEKKQQAIDELHKIIKEIAIKANKIAKYYKYYTPKKHSTHIKRYFKLMGYAFKIRSIIMQIRLIQSQPISPMGGIIAGESIIGERPTEIILSPNQRLVSTKETLKILNK